MELAVVSGGSYCTVDQIFKRGGKKLEQIEWQLLVPAVFALTMTHWAGSGLAKLCGLSNHAVMQRLSKIVEVCTAVAIVTSGVVLYFAWGSKFFYSGDYAKELTIAFIETVLLQSILVSPLVVLFLAIFYWFVRWCAVEVVYRLTLDFIAALGVQRKRERSE